MSRSKIQVSINKRNIAKMAEDIQSEFAKHPVQIPIDAAIPQRPRTILPIRHDQDRYLTAIYEADAFSVLKEANADEIGFALGLSEEKLQQIILLVIEDGHADQGGYSGGIHLTSSGRRHIEQLMTQPATASPPTVNNFNAPISNSQIATGPNSIQHQTIANNLNIDDLRQVLDLAGEIGVNKLSTPERIEFTENLQLIRQQLETPDSRVPGITQALRSLQAIAVNASGSAVGGGLVAIITGLLT